jgi:hypothetical protein
MNNDGRFVPRHRIRLVSIAKGVEVAQSTYDAGRFAWPVNEKRAKKIELVLGCVKGMVMGVYVPRHWMEATKENFPTIVATHKGLRWGFEGVEADEATAANYLGKRVPDSARDRPEGIPILR